MEVICDFIGNDTTIYRVEGICEINASNSVRVVQWFEDAKSLHNCLCLTLYTHSTLARSEEVLQVKLDGCRNGHANDLVEDGANRDMSYAVVLLL